MSLILFRTPVCLLAQEAAKNPARDGMLGLMVPMLLIGVLFYFMLLRPERRKRAEMQQMLDSLKKNDRVVTAGGILGTIVNVQKGAQEVTLRVDENSNTRLRVLRSSILRVITDEPAGEVGESS